MFYCYDDELQFSFQSGTLQTHLFRNNDTIPHSSPTEGLRLQFLLDFFDTVLSALVWAADNCFHASTMSNSGMTIQSRFMNMK